MHLQSDLFYFASGVCEEVETSGWQALVKDVDLTECLVESYKIFSTKPFRPLSHLWSRGGIYSTASWPPAPTRGCFMPILNISIISDTSKTKDLPQKVRPECSENRSKDVQNVFEDHMKE